MEELFEGGFYHIKENFNLEVENTLGFDPTKPINENKVADISVKDVKAIYPLIRAIHSERLTKNFTYYPKESLIGSDSKHTPTGYHSFVTPYGKPIILEHNLQGGFMGDASLPMGRMLVAGYKSRGKGEALTPHPKKGYPGTLEGEGYISCVAAISDPDAIPKVLGGAFHTVSIGCKVDKVFESITGIDIAKARREGKEFPPYNRGQVYDGALSYWRMGPVCNMETSFVNVPSDDLAGVKDPDIGISGLKLLLGEKKVGSKEFCFYDAKNGELVTKMSELWDMYEVDSSFKMVDSFSLPREYWWKGKDADMSVTESSAKPLNAFAQSFVESFLQEQAKKVNESNVINTINEVLNK